MILEILLQSYSFSVFQKQPLVQFLTSLSLLLRLIFFISNGNRLETMCLLPERRVEVDEVMILWQVTKFPMKVVPPIVPKQGEDAAQKKKTIN